MTQERGLLASEQLIKANKAVGDAFRTFRQAARASGPLDKQTVEFILMAGFAAAGHESPFKNHARRALEVGVRQSGAGTDGHADARRDFCAAGCREGVVLARRGRRRGQRREEKVAAAAPPPPDRSVGDAQETGETRGAVSQTRVFQLSPTSNSLAKYSASPPHGFLKYQYCCELT